MAVYAIGATFLSLEVFELPYLLILLAAQMPTVIGAAESAAPPRPAAARAPTILTGQAIRVGEVR
jgi:hypothetical protein